jgi:hypothetical protein
VNNYSSVVDCYSIEAPFGDHAPVILEIVHQHPKPKITFRRDWRKYSALSCVDSFSNIDFNIDRLQVQDYWNYFENLLVDEVDKLTPVVGFKNESGPIIKPP